MNNETKDLIADATGITPEEQAKFDAEFDKEMQAIEKEFRDTRDAMVAAVDAFRKLYRYDGIRETSAFTTACQYLQTGVMWSASIDI